MRAEICDMCDVIFAHGQRSADGTAAITFGPLFSVSITMCASKSTVNRRSLSFHNTKKKSNNSVDFPKQQALLIRVVRDDWK